MHHPNIENNLLYILNIEYDSDDDDDDDDDFDSKVLSIKSLKKLNGCGGNWCSWYFSWPDLAWMGKKFITWHVLPIWAVFVEMYYICDEITSFISIRIKDR